MYTVFFVIQIIIAAALIGIIMIQRSSDDGLGGLGGGAGGNSFLSGRASANLLTRGTAILAALFMLNSLLLANMATRTSTKPSVLDSMSISVPKGADVPADIEKTKESTPSVPLAQ